MRSGLIDWPTATTNWRWCGAPRSWRRTPERLRRESRLITDDRMAHLPDYSYAAVIAAQNTPGGYYVASTLPDSAYQAVHGSIPASSVRTAALLSDGASRLGTTSTT